ncbi:AAA family ATPase [Methylomonas sp. EFPC1]|uniref:AAA family ATPase n=1 Tax=Methylomonas sp. EFPC1 TaxID=2812647 RepID=UPI001F072B31|nr:AAA family ATPase [Methylomonas sp. EFPC1]
MILSEDTWLAHLYPDDIKTVADYVRCASNLRGAIGPHVTDLLRIGVSVVLDFPANTVANRKWMRSLIDRVESEHVLHFLDVSDDKCLTRLRARNASGSGAHAFVVAGTGSRLNPQKYGAASSGRQDTLTRTQGRMTDLDVPAVKRQSELEGWGMGPQ